jgi:hypothetical protein
VKLGSTEPPQPPMALLIMKKKLELNGVELVFINE